MNQRGACIRVLGAMAAFKCIDALKVGRLQKVSYCLCQHEDVNSMFHVHTPHSYGIDQAPEGVLWYAGISL
ncbi:hypothetical protein V8C37DRAFT_372641 [Trichoderma ceciliae]